MSSLRWSNIPIPEGHVIPLVLGMAMLVNTWWLLILLPAVIAFTHYIVVHQEEQKLEQKFGEEYREYMGRVWRYL
jgi:protein-S-isoprenylcysteine O-methyltransferase Ste14